MTDYLEQLLDNTAALLERVRRLEDSGAVSGPERGDGAPSPGKKAGREHSQTDPAEGQELWTSAPELETGRTAVREEPAGMTAVYGPAGQREDWRREEEFPLLEQLERLEQAQAALEGGGAVSGGRPAPERAGGVSYPLSLAGPGSQMAAGTPGDLAGWGEARRGLPGTELPSGGAVDWTEQADRVFRRDSRRYDGGFYLY